MICRSKRVEGESFDKDYDVERFDPIGVGHKSYLPHQNPFLAILDKIKPTNNKRAKMFSFHDIPPPAVVPATASQPLPEICTATATLRFVGNLQHAYFLS